jgi:hypothetical protein
MNIHLCIAGDWSFLERFEGDSQSENVRNCNKSRQRPAGADYAVNDGVIVPIPAFNGTT